MLKLFIGFYKFGELMKIRNVFFVFLRFFYFLFITTLIFVFSYLNSKSYSQTTQEFLISDSLSLGSILADNNNNLHLVLDRSGVIAHIKYDSLFNPLTGFRFLSNTSGANRTRATIRNDYIELRNDPKKTRL